MTELLLERMQTPVATLDLAGVVASANRAFRALVPEDPVGLRLDALFDAVLWDEVVERSRAQPYSCTLARAGRLYSTLFTADEHGLLAELVIHTQDDLPDLAQTRRLLAALEHSGETIVLTDRNARIVYVNPAFEEAMGYSRDEVLGGHNRMWRSGAHDENFYEEAWLRIQQGEVWRGELQNRRRDGTPIHEATTISRVTDTTGEVLGYVTIKRDVTAERELEQTLARAQRMESIGTLAGGVAHDFNNVLQTILGNAELVLEAASSDGEVRELAGQIKRAAEHSADLTTQLLAFARRQVVRPRPVRTNEQVAEALEMLRRLLGSGIELHWAPAADAWAVHVDPAHIGQIVTNICINARDAIADVGTIRITTANVPAAACAALPMPSEAHGDYVCIDVVDDGAGMDQETLGRIFEPFFTTKSPGAGTGLGLSTVYGIVVQNGGHVFAQSTEGAGTRISVYLPRHEGPIAIDEDTDSPREAPAPRARILVVEDEPAILRLMEAILGQAGYDVLSHATPAEALAEAAAHGDLDLVISDVIMPGMNGRDLVAELRRAMPDLRALFVSGYTADVLEGLPEEEHAKGFLQKPFARAALLEKVETLLAG